MTRVPGAAIWRTGATHERRRDGDARYATDMRHVLVLPAILVSAGCLLGGGGDGYPDDTSAVLVLDEGETCPGVIVGNEVSTVDGTDLVVDASYGGCGATRVWVCWDGAFVATAPPYAYLWVHHEPAGDCDALITQNARISLAPLSNGPSGSVIRLLLMPGVSLDDPLVWTHP